MCRGRERVNDCERAGAGGGHGRWLDWESMEESVPFFCVCSCAGCVVRVCTRMRVCEFMCVYMCPWSCDSFSPPPLSSWQWVANGVLKLICVDIGNTIKYGFPAAGADPSKFSAYSAAIEHTGQPDFNVVFVRACGVCGLCACVWFRRA